MLLSQAPSSTHRPFYYTVEPSKSSVARKHVRDARVAMLFSQAPSAAATQRPRRVRLPPPYAHAGAGEETYGGAVRATEAAETILRNGLRAESMPRHVAVVMDGNARWARARGLPVEEGHLAGRRALERMVRLSRAWGVRAITAFACSHESLSRPKVRLDARRFQFSCLHYLAAKPDAREGVRLHVIGDSPRRPTSLMNAAREAYEATRDNSDLVLMLAIGYSGRRDIVQACQGLAEEAQRGKLRPEDIDDALIADKLGTSVAGEFSCPDLLIRTSGEQRLSNFLLWQSAYSELYFTDTMWPDFDDDEYLRALTSYQKRDRRFGKRKV
ncbi:hypothetical protein EJB05_12793, partial [Eragrostis curvula]